MSACAVSLYPRLARTDSLKTTEVEIGSVRFGGPQVIIIAGPCAVESEAQTLQAAEAVRAAGASMLRGGAFKPRTSPYSFRGLREAGLEVLAHARTATGLPIVTEVMDARHLERICEVADMLQVGSRNMQNYTLLEAVGQSGRPVLLKRGMSATLEEFLLAAEYIAREGNERIVLCERGIRAFDPQTRFTLDLSAVPVLKRMTHLPVIVDPSHAAGQAWLVPHLARAAVACGADGLLVEIHPDPESALCDGEQSLDLPAFEQMMRDLRPIAAAIGRTV